MIITVRPLILMAVAAALAGGCIPRKIINNTTQQGYAPITSKSTWRITGDFIDSAKAADDNLSSYASSGNNPTASLVVDLGKPCMFNMIVIDHGPSHQYNFPNRIAVITSYDGLTWNHEYVVQGTRRITYIPLVGARLTRYIRLQTQVKSDQPWTVAEVYLQ